MLVSRKVMTEKKKKKMDNEGVRITSINDMNIYYLGPGRTWVDIRP